MMPVATIAERTTLVWLSRWAIHGIKMRTPVTDSVKVPRIKPIVLALNPRSCPRIGTAKVWTSQHIDSSQFTAKSRFRPGARSRSQAVRPSTRGARPLAWTCGT